MLTVTFVAASAFFYSPPQPTLYGKPVTSNMPVLTAPATPITYK